MNTKILLVDDDEQVLRTLSLFLKKEGYHVDTASGVASALALLKNNEYDILVTDKNMPGANGPSGKIHSEGGLELLRIVATLYPSIEVIMITGYATVDSAIEAMKLGAFDYIAKPFTPSSLKKKIERIREYKASINPENTIRIYREFRDDLLVFMEEHCNISDPRIHSAFEKLEQRIDSFFAMLKEWENVIVLQRDALSTVASLTEQALESKNDSQVLERMLLAILKESGKRI